MVIIFYYIRDFFLFIGGLIKHIFDLLSSVVQLIIEYISVGVQIIGVFPSIFIAFGTVAIIIAVLYKILGREGAE